ncbi:hypothetical protein KEM56_007440 [Ascosphaera pollenicola]|nr:hypothetical protein KEM56_007440 [Ascosphaera pollenicola]
MYGPGARPGQLILQDSILQSSSSSGLIDPIFDGTLLTKPQAFCHDVEGWGPISPFRFDFTPCFLDVWIEAVALWGVLGGIGALVLLLKYRAPQPVNKNWHLYAKLILIAVLAGTTISQAVLQLTHYGPSFFGDFRYWATISTLVSLGFIFTVQYYEHWRSRQPNGVALVYWALYIFIHGVKLRSLISRRLHRSETSYFILFTVSLGLAIFEFILEYFIPKQKSAYEALGEEDECPYNYADIFSVLTFSWMTPLMKFGYKNYITQEDLWNVRSRDRTKAVSTKLTDAWHYQVENHPKPSLWLALSSAFYGPYLRASLIKVISDILNFSQPQLLRLLIRRLFEVFQLL